MIAAPVGKRPHGDEWRFDIDDFDPRGLAWPDIDAFGRGNSGVDYVHRFDGAAPGPQR